MATTSDDTPMASKASMVRGFIDALRSAGLLDAVCAKVSAPVREFLLDPPPASAWVDWGTTDELMLAIDAVGLFVAAAGGVDAIFDVCSTKGRVREIEVASDGNGNAVRLHCEWQPRG